MIIVKIVVTSIFVMAYVVALRMLFVKSKRFSRVGEFVHGRRGAGQRLACYWQCGINGGGQWELIRGRRRRRDACAGRAGALS